MNQFKNDYVVVINKKPYCFDLEKVKEICFISGKEQLTDTKITDVSSLDDEENNGTFVTQKVVEENKYSNTQVDVLMQDIVKSFILKLLDMPDAIGDDMDFSSALAFNTCLNCGIIKEIV